MHLKYWMIVYLHIEHDGVDLRNDSDQHLKAQYRIFRELINTN